MASVVSHGLSERYSLTQIPPELPPSRRALQFRLRTCLPNHIVVGAWRLFPAYDGSVAGDAYILITGLRILFTLRVCLTVHLIRDTNLVLTNLNVRSNGVAFFTLPYPDVCLVHIKSVHLLEIIVALRTARF